MDVVRQEAARGIRPEEANPGRGRGVDRAKTATASTPETGSASGSKETWPAEPRPRPAGEEALNRQHHSREEPRVGSREVPYPSGVLVLVGGCGVEDEMSERAHPAAPGRCSTPCVGRGRAISQAWSRIMSRR